MSEKQQFDSYIKKFIPEDQIYFEYAALVIWCSEVIAYIGTELNEEVAIEFWKIHRNSIEDILKRCDYFGLEKINE